MDDRKKPVRLKLDIQDTDENLVLIGIVSSEPDYKLSLALNKKLNISLKLSNPIELTDRKGNISSFSRFADTSEMPEISYTLVSNRSGNNVLFKKMKKLDYIFSISHSYPIPHAGNIIRTIREIEGVTAAFELDSKEFDYRLLQN